MHPELSSRQILAAAAVLVAASSVVASAADKKPLAIGDAAPRWADLHGVDDKPHSLKDLVKRKAVVVVFTCDHCPVARAYEKRLAEFDVRYREKGVELVAINVSAGEADDPAKMKALAADRGFKFIYLLDPSQDVGRAYGATVTPHVFVLDSKHRIAYMGAFDDSQNPVQVKKHYAQDAVDAILAGDAPKVAKTDQFGCAISYE